MYKKLYFLAIVLVFALPSFAQTGSGSLKGVIKDEKTGETIPFAAVVAKEGETQIAGTATDIDGKYTIKPLRPGKYDLYIQVVGYNTKMIAGVLVKADKITFQDVNMAGGINLEEIDVVEYVVPLIDKDGGASGGTVSSEDIAKMPLRDASSIATTVAGVTADADGDLNVRGARSDNTYYYIDGVKVIGSTQLPKSAIQEVSVITGGVPANYGDVTGGIINITTKGAAPKLYGGIELLSSGFKSGEDGVGLDKFGYNLVEGYLSGPLAFKKDSLGNRERSVLGFFISGNYISELDNRPTFGLTKINDDARQRLIDNPLRINTAGTAAQYNAEFLHDDSFHAVSTRQNAKEEQVNATAKLDISPSELFDISVGLNYNWQKRNRTRYVRFGRDLMNSEFNPQSIDKDLRTYVRFVQRFKNNPNGKGVKNAFYSILADYTVSSGEFQDPDHTDNYFNYGYLGKYETHSQPFYAFDDNRQAYVHAGFEDTLVTYAPSNVNSEAAAVTNQYFSFFGDNENGNISSLTAIQAGNGLLNGEGPPPAYGLWAHPGTRSNFYRKYDNQQFRISANGSADIGEHALQLGIEFEQRIESRFALGDNGRGPRDLWTLSRLQANSHLRELDRSDSTITFPEGTYAYITYPVLIDLNSQSTFDRNLRTSLGMDPDGDVIIDVDALDPEQLNLGLFSPDELLNSGVNYVEYRGYDYTGKKTSGSSNFNDFFTQTGDDGNFTRSIGAYSPNYVAGYIMDKFALNDIIFNVGVRIDRFDANQGVLKDPFVIGETFKAGEVNSIGGDPVSHPSGIGNDYVVYVDDVDNPSVIKGYRNDEQWFDAQGSPIEDPSILSEGGVISPYLVHGGDDDKNLATAFEDYSPQVNVMPRIAFSFPISDVALFFAHYDVLTQRPTGNNILNPIDYLFIRTTASARNFDEPNLKSEKTTDYELGFQQVVSKTSSIKLSAFYRQMENNIQLRSYVGAYPVNYNTFDNIDFGTVKGFSITYDLRRTGNVRLNVSYTLQFAEGTGSSSTTAAALINAGQPNLRTIYPLDFDTRHNVVATFDFRYGRGASYNGPMIGSSQILADFGVNFIGTFNSGTPYSDSKTVSSLFENNNRLIGQLNGSRLPTTTRLDLQIDQSFPIRLGTDADGNKKMGNLNIYLWIANLINTQNIINVYRYTGSPDDDGYLADPRGEQDIKSRLDPDSFVYYYNTSMRTPLNYGRARTIRLGLRFDF